MHTTTRLRAARAAASLLFLVVATACTSTGGEPEPDLPFGFSQLNVGPEGGVLEHGAARLLVPPGAVSSLQGFSLDDSISSFVSPLGEPASHPFSVRLPGGMQLPVEVDLVASKNVDLSSPTLRVVFRETAEGELSQIEGVFDRNARVVRVRLLRGGELQLATVTKVAPVRLRSLPTLRFVVNEPVSRELQSDPNDEVRNFVRVAGDLPPGMFLSGQGRLTGTPTMAGRFAFGFTWDAGVTKGESVFVVQVAHSVSPQATVVQLSPTSVREGDPDFGLDVTGNDFVLGSQVAFEGVALPTTYLTPYWLRAKVPASLVAVAGTRQVTVRNPSPAVGESAPIEFVVQAPTSNCNAATITDVQPVPIPAGSTNLELTIYVTNRTGDATVILNSVAGGTHVLETSSSAGTWVRVFVPDELVAVPGELGVVVRNNPNGTFCDSVRWDMPIVGDAPDGGSPDGGWVEPERNPVPNATEANPDLVEQWQLSASVRVTGTGFTPQTTFRLNGELLEAGFESGTQMQVTIPGKFLVKTGSLSLMPENPPLGGGEGRGVRVEVIAPASAPPPALFEAVPSSFYVPPAGVLVDLYGARFIAGARVLIDGMPMPTKRLSESHLRAVILPPQPLSAGPHLIAVRNSETPERVSEGTWVNVLPPVRPDPALGPLDRLTTARGVDARLPITGTGFVPGVTRVYANGHLVAASFSSDRTGQVVLPAEMLTSQVAAVGLQVKDGPNGELSGVRSVDVVPRQVALQQVVPSRIVAGSGSLPVTLRFVPGRDAPIAPVAYVGSRPLRTISPLVGWQMVVELPGDLLPRPAVVRLKVVDGEAASNEVLVGVDSNFDTALPRLDSIQPSTVSRAAATQITLQGALFPNTGYVLIGTRRFPFTAINASTASVSLDIDDIPTAGTYPLTVSYDSAVVGAASRDLKFTVVGTNPVPTITGFDPPVLPVNAPDTVVTLTGANFLGSETTIRMNSMSLGTCDIVGTTCRVRVSAALLTQATTLTFVAQNPEPGGGFSTAASLPVQVGSPIPAWGPIPYPTALPVSSTAVEIALPVRGLTALTQVLGPSSTPLTIVHRSSYALIAQVPAPLLTLNAFLNVVASNPAPVGGSTTEQWLQVANVPKITGVDPAVFNSASEPVTVTLTGSGFQVGGGPQPLVRLDDARKVQANVVSDGTITATIPADAIPATGFLELRVWFEGAFESNTAVVHAP